MYANKQGEYGNSLQITEESLMYLKSYLLANVGGSNITFEAMAKFADLDYRIFIDNCFYKYLECKVRYHNFGKYKKEKMPFRKFAVAQTLKSVYGKESIYMVIFDDKIGIFDLFEKPDDIKEMVARWDRGEDKDIYALYDINNFTIIKEKIRPKYNYK